MVGTDNSTSLNKNILVFELMHYSKAHGTNFLQFTRYQWRTLRIIVGGAKSYYMTVEGANLKYFVFYMVKKGKC
jgi:hypothetical protein